MKRILQIFTCLFLLSNSIFAQSDEPCGATMLTVNTAAGCASNIVGFINPPAFTNSTNASAGVTLPALTCAGFTTATRDFWFRAVVPSSGQLSIAVSDGGTGTQLSTFWDMAVYSSSSGTCASSTFTLIGSECDASTYPIINLSGLTVGATLYIRMWRQAGSVQTDNRAYTICLNDPAVVPLTCTTPIDPPNATVLYQAPTLFWDESPLATSYDVYFGTTNPPPFAVNTTNTFISISGSTPNTTAYWYVVPKNSFNTATGCASTVRSYTMSPNITNNECAGAIMLNEGTIETGTTLYATQSRAPSSCSGGTSVFAHDVWYKFKTNSVGGNVSIDVLTFIENGVSMDAVVQAYSGTCTGTLTSLGCVDDWGEDDFETLNLTGLAPNTTYYVRVYGWQTSGATPSPLIYQPFDIEVYGPGVVIPIELLSFSGKKEGKTNRLDWKTATERDVKEFVIERSNDAGKGFEPIGNIKAVGNSTVVNTYHFTDLSPFAVTYYRLRSVDVDGSDAFSKVVTVERSGDKFAIKKIFPSPATQETTIEFESNQTGTIELSITDMLGRIVFVENKTITEGAHFEKINIAHFTNGHYFVKIKSGLNVVEGRFVKN